MNYIEILKILLNKPSISTFSLYVVSILYIGYGYFNKTRLMDVGIYFFIFTTILIILFLKDKTIDDKLSIQITPFNFLMISFFGVIGGSLLNYGTMIYIGILTFFLGITIIICNFILDYVIYQKNNKL